MSKSLNKVMLIGNATKDPELRYTQSNVAFTTFCIATNRQWKTESGDKKSDVEYHNVVAWRSLGEIASKYITKGKKIYIEGRLATRQWETESGQKRTATEIIADDIIILSHSDKNQPSA